MSLALAAAGVAVNALWAWLAARECRRRDRHTAAAAVLAFALFQAIVWAGTDPFLPATATAAAEIAAGRTAIEIAAAVWTVAIAPMSVLIAVAARLVRLRGRPVPPGPRVRAGRSAIQ